MPKLKFDLEWADGPLGCELRWGIRKREGQPLINSTRVALITRDGDKITEAGQQETFVVKMNTLFDDGEYSEEALRFATLHDAKVSALAIAADIFTNMQNVAHDKRFKERKHP